MAGAMPSAEGETRMIVEVCEVVACPEQEMDTPADDCIGCEYFEMRDDYRIYCKYSAKGGKE
jgi:hypothetical protein